ncbi:MAG: tyrosine-type recombinase/integrase [Pseudomonadota bacterium]|nr:tyrosine-type recombinase/integrase [Pseudomonadota bacterium]
MSGEGKSPATIAGYVSDVQRYGGMDGACTSERATQIRLSGLAPRTVARHLAAHAEFARYTGNAAEAASLFARRPSVGVVLPPVVPTQDEMRQFIGAETDLVYRALWTLMCGAGLRLDEAMSLRWHSFTTTGVNVLGKGNKMRTVPLSMAVREAVAAIDTPLARNLNSLLFPMSHRTVQRHVKSNARRAGLPRTWHPHALRHGFGTAIQAAMGDIRLTADIMGHASVVTTMIYTHVANGRREAAVAGVL